MTKNGIKMDDGGEDQNENMNLIKEVRDYIIKNKCGLIEACEKIEGGDKAWKIIMSDRSGKEGYGEILDFNLKLLLMLSAEYAVKALLGREKLSEDEMKLVLKFADRLVSKTSERLILEDIASSVSESFDQVINKKATLLSGPGG